MQLFAFRQPFWRLLGMALRKKGGKTALLEKLAPEHRPAVVNAKTFTSALTTMQKIVALDPVVLCPQRRCRLWQCVKVNQLTAQN